MNKNINRTRIHLGTNFTSCEVSAIIINEKHLNWNFPIWSSIPAYIIGGENLNITFYHFINLTGNVPEDCIGKEIIDIYNHKDYGLCIGMFNCLLAKQFYNNEKSTNKLKQLKTIRSSKNIDELSKFYGIQSIMNIKPIKSFPVTFDILKNTPDTVLKNLILLLRYQKENKINMLPEFKNIKSI